MIDPSSIKHVCVHGHFYQPPRENPWLEEIEKEESASPFHDWNERINAECYRANAAARLVDDRNRVISLHNNYGRLSFNFGPTLMKWLERNDPWVYRVILDSDRKSCERSNGHGNAIAQVYNHIIMPLANRRDKKTQILWGLRDFEHRFGRRAEGMWLAETAVDRETLALMAEAGVRFTVLSPFQAARWRFIHKPSSWKDARGGAIPTGRAYRYNCGAGRNIHLFFYDSNLSRGIAFERLLEHSSRLVAGIDAAFKGRDASNPEPWLVHTATDGESYGHHFKFGDMALAAVFREFEKDPSARVMNYGTFLEEYPVRAEADIIENTAWSCAHGLGRWSEDCGCRIGGMPGWNQRWRAPLRAALNHLRDVLAKRFERAAQRLSKDPWKARDEYIDVVLDPEGALEGFLDRNMIGSRSRTDVQRFLQLLEMQRFSMLMFTSCGWFFDEISSLESTLILRYAARAVQLAEEIDGDSPEPSFLKLLAKAPSNLPEFGDGAGVYKKLVRPGVLGRDRVAASYAIQSLSRSARRQFSFYGFDISPQHEEDLGAGSAPCLYGHIRVKSGRTLVEEDFLYAVIHFGGLDFRCSVKPYMGEEEYRTVLRRLERAVEEQNTVEIIRIMDGVFGTSSFSLQDVFRDLRTSIALETSRKTLAAYTEFQRYMFRTNRPLLASLGQLGIRIPGEFRVAVRRVLSDQIGELIEDILVHERRGPSVNHFWDSTDFYHRAHTAHLQLLLGDARSWKTSLRIDRKTSELGGVLVDTLRALDRSFTPSNAGRLYRLLNVCETLGNVPEIWTLQTLYFELIGKLAENPDLLSRVSQVDKFLNELDRILGCRFAVFLGDMLASVSKEVVPLTGSTAVVRSTRG